MVKTKIKFPKWLLVCCVTALALFAIGICAVFGLNAWVCASSSEYIITEEKAAKLKDIDCIIVLGCKVQEDGTLSHMLEDRMKRGIALQKADAAPKLLVSGDHGREDYDEVAAMKKAAVDAGVASEDVFMDHAGFSTYDTMYRAKEVFGAERVIIVTQGYHLYRAVYIARALGLEAYGVDADYRSYVGQFARDVREVLARVKDFGMCVFKPKPTYLGDVIPINGSGVLTHDENSDF